MKRWVDHFENLNSKDPAEKAQNYQYCNNIKLGIEVLQRKLKGKYCHILDKNISILEIKRFVKGLKSGKASGSDSICNEILKSTKEFIAPILASLFSKILELEYFPMTWSLNLIVPIHKSGELDDPNNFRGISLNSCLSKLFTNIMNFRLTNICEDNNYVDCNQIGFRKGLEHLIMYSHLKH